MDLIKVAIRNVGRNKRRSLITIFTVFIGVVVVTGARGLLNGLQNEIRSGLTRKMNGDLQVHVKGYQNSLDANPYKILMPHLGDLTRTLKSTPGVESTSPRLRVMGLLNHQRTQTTVPVFINAIDSARELEVCPRLATSLQEGTLLDSSQEIAAHSVDDPELEEAPGLDTPLEKRAQEKSEAPRAVGHHEIMVTPNLLRGMDARIGDEVVVLLQDKNNMQQALVAKISGVIDFAMPGANARMAWMDLSTLQKTLGIENQASEIAIRTAKGVSVDRVKKNLQAALPNGLVTETWLETAGLLRDAMTLQNVVFTAILVIVFSIVISAIVNTSLMTVMERTREIGSLMALGYRRRHILLLFLTESAAIGLTGGISGTVLVSIVLAALHERGLHFALPGQTTATVLYPEVTLPYIGLVLGLSIFSALAASIFPAYRASRMKPVDALSHS